MSWINELYQTYETHSSQIAKQRTDGRTPLLPIAHTLQKAHVEMELNENAEIVTVRTLSQEEADTILPCTEDSASRTSGCAPHALYDNLIYIAGDYERYFEGKGNEEAHRIYLEQLTQWCESDCCTDDVKVIQAYLEKGRVITDLVAHDILETDETGRIKKEWKGDKKNKPLDMTKILVRFRVKHGARPSVKCNENRELFDAYRDYYLSHKQETRLCYVTGHPAAFTDKHPSRLRSGGDNAKLISGNDSAGFTYRGRFHHASEAVSVGYEVSQKAHHALRWLIDTQGWKNGEQVVLAWGVAGGNYPSVAGDGVDLFGNELITEDSLYSTKEELAKRLKNAAQGYGAPKGLEQEDVVVMALEAATPGRLSITYYRELKGSEFLDNIRNWHSTCIWNHSYKTVVAGTDEKGKLQYRHVRYTGAPSPADIVFAAYGPRVDEKLKRKAVERLLPCIVEKRAVPRDLMISAVQRASNPPAMEPWEWRKTLSIACALVKKYREDKYKEEWDMAVDYNCKERSYLFGRLLAYADNIERLAMVVAEAKPHETNAQKLEMAFVAHPAKTWMIINRQLKPYKARLLGKYDKMVADMYEVLSELEMEDFYNNQPLDERYLLGYACQMTEFNMRIQAARKRQGSAPEIDEEEND